MHTRNLIAFPSASIAISEPDTAQVHNPQTLARVSLQGEARPLQENSPGYAEAKTLYIKRFPDSSPLFGLGDFLLFRLVPRRYASSQGLRGVYRWRRRTERGRIHPTRS
jgi:putative heme iron utilization protein